MRILLITHYYAPEFGAPQRRWSALAQRFLAAGHRLTVVTPVPHYPEGRPTAELARRHRVGAVERGAHGETVLRTGYLPHRSADIVTRSADHAVAGADALRRLLLRFRRPETRPDVVIATAPAIESLVVGRAVASLWKVPLVVEMRDAWPDLVTHIGAAAAITPVPTRPVSLPRAALRGIAAQVKRAVHAGVSEWQQGADEVVTTTERFAEVLRERGNRSVDVVRNGADLELVTLHQDHPVGREELRCLYLGNMGRSQGLENVVRAAARLHHEGVPIRVRMIGHGVEAHRLRALAEALDAPVSVHGRIPHREVRTQYAWADSVVVSLRDWEPFAWTVPSKLYELLATGRHVTAVVAGESARVVHDAEAGDVVPPGDVDALVDLWRDLQADRSRAQVRDSGRAWVAANASDEVLAESYLRILDGLAASASRR